MPTVTNAKLSLEPVGTGTDIKITVKYDINFSRLESNMAKPGLGIMFRELVELIGVDPPGSKSGTSMVLLGIGQLFPVLQDAPQTLRGKTHTRTVPRVMLDEDPGLLAADSDELRARIRILTFGLPKDTINEFTDQIVLNEGGDVISSATATG